MRLLAPTKTLILQICEEWNRAEKAIKIAEQVLGDDPFPSVKELRYCGRRVVEAFSKIDAGDDAQEVNNLLTDALYDCYRAKHDAMDVAVQEIAGRIKFAQSDLGVEVVISCFPAFPKLIALMTEVEVMTAESRENREVRDDLYLEIQQKFDAIIPSYAEFNANEKIMKEMADEADSRRIEQQVREDELKAEIEKIKLDMNVKIQIAEDSATKSRKINYILAGIGILLTTGFGVFSFS